VDKIVFPNDILSENRRDFWAAAQLQNEYAPIGLSEGSSQGMVAFEKKQRLSPQGPFPPEHMIFDKERAVRLQPSSFSYYSFSFEKKATATAPGPA
jgi:hypothetical protein